VVTQRSHCQDASGPIGSAVIPDHEMFTVSPAWKSDWKRGSGEIDILREAARPIKKDSEEHKYRSMLWNMARRNPVEGEHQSCGLERPLGIEEAS
jgi:hypothetical protein